MTLQVARYVVAAGLALVTVALMGLIVVLILRGGMSTTAPSLAALLSFLGILLGLIANLLATGGVAHTLGDVQAKVNGHLQQHIGHTDDQVNALIDQRLGQQPPAEPPGP